MKTNPLVPPTARAPRRAARPRLTVWRVLLAALVSFAAGMAFSYWKNGFAAPPVSADVAPAAAKPAPAGATAPTPPIAASLSSLSPLRTAVPAPAAERLEPPAPGPVVRRAEGTRAPERAKAPRRDAERRDEARKRRKADRDDDSDEARKTEKRKDSKRRHSDCAS